MTETLDKGQTARNVHMCNCKHCEYVQLTMAFDKGQIHLVIKKARSDKNQNQIINPKRGSAPRWRGRQTACRRVISILFVAHFTTSVIRLSARMIHELERIWKEAVMV
jgi:hypothetical protein